MKKWQYWSGSGWEDAKKEDMSVSCEKEECKMYTLEEACAVCEAGEEGKYPKLE